MIKSQALSHPEIELRPSFFRSSRGAGQPRTFLDLLEVYPDHVSLKENLDHLSLLNHFRFSEAEDLLNGERPQPLRIFFVEEFDFVDPQRLKAEPTLEINTTACFHSPTSLVKSGSASLIRTENGKRVALDGFYRISSGFAPPVAHVWFSHSLLEGQSSTYIIHGCPEIAKNLILTYVEQRNPILRPLSIDAILFEYSLYEWGQGLSAPRNHLVAYENTSISQFTPSQTAEAVEKLHALSQILHIIRGDVTDLQELLQYLVGVHKRLTALSAGRYDPVDIESVEDSFAYLISKTDTLKVWAVNYAERTGIRINLFFNLATQSDSRTNLEIARLTSKIAVSTQRDSSSMIT
ncbi:hypothetical protein M413DRAFT_29808 [Hebeloma cylindrosporum]|uniref:Uncharacterized protein n=1 Tax=Hebeloma cylindrosporum TaxID=76867 RepID=A0A0C2YCW1_HEBCY|nr:hypothetical protein M413DRAFT_29808 [Hebeloma cylindrosporum h7]